MADSMTLMYGPETESPSSEKAGPQIEKLRIPDYLFMGILLLVISFVFFIVLDQFLMPFSGAVSGRAALVEGRPSDESIEQVKAWIQQNRQEAGTIEFIEWSPVREIQDTGFSIRTRYLFRNTSGEVAVGNKVFFLDFSGNVINVWTLAG